MIARWKLPGAALWAVVAFARLAYATDRVEGFDWHAHDPLLYEDIVVEGVIDGVEFKVIDSEILDPAFREPEAWIGVLHLSAPHVLRGGRLELPINVEIFFDWRNVIGQRVIVCGRWWPGLNGYLVRPGNSVVLAKDDGWERMNSREVLSREQLTSMMSQVRPEQIARRAGLVVVGTVSLLEDSIVTDGTAFRGRIQKVTMDELDVLAGTIHTTELMFETYNWVARIPTIKAGERWVVFLERKAGRWRIISGLNGMLKVADNDQLRLGGSAPFALSRPELVRMIRQARGAPSK